MKEKMNSNYQQAEIPRPDEKQIRTTYQLFKRPDACVELRAIGNKSAKKFEDRLSETGFFVDETAFVREAMQYSGRKQVYVGLNPRPLDLLHSQPANRLSPGEGGKTTDISVRNTFCIDIDTKRSNPRIAASNEEIHNALVVFENIKSELNSKKIHFVSADSGNGKHLNIFTVPYPVSSETESKTDSPFALLLRYLQRKYGNAAAEVDVGTYDAPRVWKVYGTVAMKGGNTIDRPWRVARIIDLPESWAEPIDILNAFKDEISEQKILEQSQSKKTTTRRSSIDIVALFGGR